MISSIAILITAKILPGVKVDNITTGIFLAIILAALNTFLKPVLVLLTIPITIFTLGLFLLVINAGVIILADKMVAGFSVSSFGNAVLFSIVLSIVSSILTALGKNKNEQA
ncbi:MAG: hypothetical protein RIQ89_672 [Bacteroidota bacterium]